MIKGKDYPEWLTDEGLKMLKKSYLYRDENVYQMYERIADAAAKNLNKPEYREKFYDALVKNWLCPATPIVANLGTDRGLPISCYGLTVPDSIDGIYSSVREMALLSKGGGGVGIDMSSIRPRGTPIKSGDNGTSDGIVPWIKIFDSAVIATNQGSVRRGACSMNLDINHGDIHEYLKIRRQTGDVNRQCLNIHHSVTVDDSFMRKLDDPANVAERELWLEILKTRSETGEPFILFKDNVNKANPAGYKERNFAVNMTNICTEITLFSDFGHSLVCCLSSLNLARYDEWKETDVIKTAVYFLEGVLNEYIRKASGMIGHEKTVRFAEKSRAIGIGVLGWHTLLQKRMEPFGSFEAMRLNAEIHSKIARESAEASVELAAVFGEPEWCRGTGRRHSHLTAVAPTRSNSIVSGSVSYGVEPIPANAFVERTSTGATIKRNRILEELLERKGHNTDEIWSAIVKNNGSVAGLPEEILSAEEKAVFLTAYELNQYDIIRQAAQRQQFIEQAQSINLFFPPNVDPRYFHGVHKKAWEMGMKSLYYCRTTSVLIADSASRTSEEQGRRNLESRIYRTFDECSACES